MLQTMDEHFPAEVTWTQPEGGLFLMVTMPAHLNARDILKAALAHDVAFVPWTISSLATPGTIPSATRNEYVSSYPSAFDPAEFYMPRPIEVQVGGASVWVLDVLHFEPL